MKRTRLYKAGVIAHTLSSLFAVLSGIPALMQGPSAPGISEGVPQFAVALPALLGVAGLISAYGAWQGQKWGIALTIFLEALNGLVALPGVLFAPTTIARLSASTGVLISVFVIFALLRRPKPTTAHSVEE